MKKNRFLALALALLVAFSQVSVLAEDKTTHEIAPTVLSKLVMMQTQTIHQI
ncbi:hypothetical protein MGH68_02285 [Erysipelothrix sp. D19-032]